MTNRKSIISSVLALVFALILVQHAYADSNQKNILFAAKQIVKLWQDELSGGCRFVFPFKDATWAVRVFKSIKNVKYDVKKTDSLVSPYVLTILADTVLYQGGGYDSAAKAKQAKDLKPFPPGNSKAREMQINYAFQDGYWVLTGGNKIFEGNIYKAMKLDENRDLKIKFGKITVK